jgi:predicted anti-sigma-YlaC factor YlaD
MDPVRALGGEPTGWDEAVNVRMMKQVLAPGMQDGKESNLCSQVARIAGYLL